MPVAVKYKAGLDSSKIFQPAAPFMAPADVFHPMTSHARVPVTAGDGGGLRFDIPCPQDFAGPGRCFPSALLWR
ncbi:MAG: hypothetical protein BGO99_02445 [Nitrosospira sp. 56-18]|nr:MAG: hypothetical protein BGO99_02445 [Nitrosospira sp. 56-18]